MREGLFYVDHWFSIQVDTSNSTNDSQKIRKKLGKILILATKHQHVSLDQTFYGTAIQTEDPNDPSTIFLKKIDLCTFLLAIRDRRLVAMSS